MTIRPLKREDAGGLAGFLAGQPRDYREHFHPFPDETEEGLRSVVGEDSKDRFWGVFDEENDDAWLACFLLRGWEEGYERPSFGVIVDHRRAGLGLGRMCLQVAHAYCRLRGVPSCMLKVSAENPNAQRIYEDAGYTREGVCPRTGHLVYSIDFSRP